MKLFFGLLLLTFFTVSCFYGEVYKPLPGLLYTNIHFDGDFDPENNVKEDTIATGCVQHFLRLYSWGNAGAGSIAKENGIIKISYIDHHLVEFLFIYGKYCTYVHGQKNL
ncbi:TRL-like family protein [Leptospira levettii]|uniref:TRL-like family protein n=1 Tax=Leptospira levettii TaxID=2023178 RepID=A0AAW5VA26_9LEPT|nr:TRL-like family protein [Leptospira levettii]MCW7464442.1 TRL-like family protein [Leptospira levettii]MCW7511374.1 TRL-like family protein [Leptospira levettii]MCW7515128.1 TRL-like family protein [Leptospira levettii]